MEKESGHRHAQYLGNRGRRRVRLDGRHLRKGAICLIVCRAAGSQRPGGKKLLATGNGRCNLTNQGGLKRRYHGDAAFAGQVFENFGVEETLSLFDRWGVSPVVLEDGKVYPRSLQASAVLDALRLRAQELGVEVRCGCGVEDIQPVRNGFLLHCTGRRVHARGGGRRLRRGKGFLFSSLRRGGVPAADPAGAYP